MIKEMKKVSIVIPIYIIDHNFFKMTKDCIDQVVTTTNNVELIIVDDCSPSEKLVGLLKRKCDSNIKWIHNKKNLGFAHSINAGMANSTGDLILLLNNDVKFTKTNWLDKLTDGLKNSDLVSADFGVLGEDWHYIPKSQRQNYKGQTFKYPVAWALLFRRALVEKEGGLATCFGKGYWEDTLYYWMLSKKGYKAKYIIDTGIKHEEHKTFKAIGSDLFNIYNSNREIFLRIKSGKEQCILPKLEDYLRKENGNTKV